MRPDNPYAALWRNPAYYTKTQNCFLSFYVSLVRLNVFDYANAEISLNQVSKFINANFNLAHINQWA